MRHKEVIDVDTLQSMKILAHEDRIERALGHFVQNAAEAVQHRAGSVRIRVQAEGSFAVVAIADDGVGMTSDFVREKLFHPFQTTKPQGMGIGMYESYQYINGIGGRINVETAPDSGTRFDIYLPIAYGTCDSEAFSGKSA
jgi:C4-dicarboxylate-specific signal transduction histidine kinase